MKPSLGLMVKPPTRRGAEEALKSLCTLRPEALFLNLPRSLEGLVSGLGKELSYEEFLEEVMERPELPEPRGAWILEHEPILRGLQSLGGRFETYCYGDDAAFVARAKTSIEIALLTVRDAIKGEVSVRDWLRVLRKEVDEEERALEREADYVAEAGQGYGRILCISGFEAKRMKRELQNRYETWIRYLAQPYHFPPLEVLKRVIARGEELGEEDVEELVKEHIRFIREYVYYMPLLEAMERWAREKLYWILGGRTGVDTSEKA